jgi:hypothetical protein
MIRQHRRNDYAQNNRNSTETCYTTPPIVMVRQWPELLSESQQLDRRVISDSTDW